MRRRCAARRIASIVFDVLAAAARLVEEERKGVRVEAEAVRLSPIFQWFAEDFRAGGGVLAFVRRFASPPLREALDRFGDAPRLVYFDYDWSLNGWPRQDDDTGEESSRRDARSSRA